jgi:hypothetical protein
VNRIDRETVKEARAHKGCRAIQDEEEEEEDMYVTDRNPESCTVKSNFVSCIRKYEY